MENKEELFEKFMTFVYTKEQLARFIDDIDLTSSYINKVDQNITLIKRIQDKVSREFYDSMSSFEKEGLLPNTKKSQSEFLSELKIFSLKLPVCKLTIAFHPGKEFLKKTSDWFYTLINKKIILDTTVKESIIGGAEIEFDGEYRDFTFSTKAKEVIRNLYLKGDKG